MSGFKANDYVAIGLAAVVGLGMIGMQGRSTVEIEGEITNPTRVKVRDGLISVDSALCENGTLELHVARTEWKGPVGNCALGTIKRVAEQVPGMENIAKRIPSEHN